MNEEFRELRSTVDWWSRLIALGSLLVSGAAFYYAYLQERTLPVSTKSPADVTAMDSKSGPANPTPAVTDSENMLSSAKTSEQSRLDEPAAGTSAPIDWTTEKSRPVDAEKQASTADANPPDTAGPDTKSEEADGTIDDLEKPLEPPMEQDRGAPMLATVRTMLKPTSDLDYANATVRNNGDGTARILELIFDPDEVDELPIEAAARPNWGTTDDTQIVVRFNDQDNRTSIAGRHGNYVRELQAPYVVEPGKSVDLKLLVENSEHVGYELMGKLTMRLEGGNEFQIDRVAIPFVQP